MLARYQIVDYNTRVALGNTSAGPYSTSVMADIVGLLTGTITNVSQLSSFASKDDCIVQGALGNWTVYDDNAHPTVANKAKVLRRLNTDGVTYQYLFLAFNITATRADALIGYFGVMGGWNTVTKAPTTTLYFTKHVGEDTFTVNANVALTATNVPLATDPGSAPNGSVTVSTFNSNTDQLLPSIPYTLLSTPSMLSIWPSPMAGAIAYPSVMIAEYTSADLWSNSTTGVPPIVYGVNCHNTPYMTVRAPYLRNSAGNLVDAFSAQLRSLAGSGSTWKDVSASLDAYAVDASGGKIIPVFPIDAMIKNPAGDVFCYGGRLKEVFATMAVLAAGDTFTVGTDTYIVIPTGLYKSTLASYSSGGKVCAKVQ